MEHLRTYLWLWVIIVVIFVCAVISIIFIFINICISSRGKHSISELHKRASDFSVKGNKYQEKCPKASKPPLPARTQFLTEAQSYENLSDEHDYEEVTPEHEVAAPEHVVAAPEHEEDTPEYEEATPEYEEAAPEYEEATPEYEEATPEYQQGMLDQFDYVKVEDEAHILPPPYKDPDPAADDASTEDYDDIGGEDVDEEDYDDLG